MNGYRYTFNGKEKDSDIGEDDYDYGARIYDARIGRWLSLDPLQKKYPSYSPYVFTLNNPIVYLDEDGRDVGISIKRNSDGKGGTITLTSDVYVKGQAAEGMALSFQSTFNQKAKNLLQGTYVDNDGNKWDVKISMVFKAAKSVDEVRIAKNQYKNPKAENLLKMDDNNGSASFSIPVNGKSGNTVSMYKGAIYAYEVIH